MHFPRAKNLALSNTIRTRFFKYTVKGEMEDDCWEWVGTVEKNGNGLLFIAPTDLKSVNVRENAQRISFVLRGGVISDALDEKVGHTCTKRLCVNPKHLVLRNSTEVGQYKADNRLTQHSENHHGTRLKEHQIHEMTCINS